jgi:hypothetical protein
MRLYMKWLLLAALGVSVGFCETDPMLLGTWKLIVSQSKYIPGPPPRSQTRTYGLYEGGVKVVIKSTLANGESSTIEYPANEDGKDYPITGTESSLDAISLEKSGDHAAKAVLKHAGKDMAVAERIISPDGKTMTITYKANDSSVNNKAVYEKQ